MTVSSTRNETEADRAHHLSKTIDQTLVLREAQTKIPTRVKKEEQRDRSRETDRSARLKKEEEADPDLEFTSETGHVHVEGPLHHMHGLAKNPKAKAKIAKVKAKAKIPRTKTGKVKRRMQKVKCKCRRTSTTFQTKLCNGTENFATTPRVKFGPNAAGNTKFSNTSH